MTSVCNANGVFLVCDLLIIEDILFGKRFDIRRTSAGGNVIVGAVVAAVYVYRIGIDRALELAEVFYDLVKLYRSVVRHTELADTVDRVDGVVALLDQVDRAHQNESRVVDRYKVGTLKRIEGFERVGIVGMEILDGDRTVTSDKTEISVSVYTAVEEVYSGGRIGRRTDDIDCYVTDGGRNRGVLGGSGTAVAACENASADRDPGRRCVVLIDIYLRGERSGGVYTALRSAAVDVTQNVAAVNVGFG